MIEPTIQHQSASKAKTCEEYVLNQLDAANENLTNAMNELAKARQDLATMTEFLKMLNLHRVDTSDMGQGKSIGFVSDKLDFNPPLPNQPDASRAEKLFLEVKTIMAKGGVKR